MCGIAGLRANIGNSELEKRITLMRDSMTHRGPNSFGNWFDNDNQIAFGHRRLSIIELSPLGHQPMISLSGRYVITFNGEIYNYRTLKTELEAFGYKFQGGSDTEVILVSIEQWGIEEAILKLTGMFAFAIRDRLEKVTYLVRDRIGKKPLYYYAENSTWAFASELKALVHSKTFKPEISRESLSLYMRYGYIPEKHSIYKHVYKVPPGGIVKLHDHQAPEQWLYWDIKKIAENGQKLCADISQVDIIDNVERILCDAVGLRMIADVPLGAFLSGGIDSSLIVALMQTQSSKPVKTYTIGFKDPRFNEAEHAREVARHLGTDHHELYIDGQDLLRVLPELPFIVDEPLADISILPTYLVSKLAVKDVTVALSGDGGDELFCGYTHYFRASKAWRQSRTFHYLGGNIVGKWLSNKNYGMGKLARAGALIAAKSQEELCSALISQWQHPEETVIGGTCFDLKKNITDSKEMLADIRNYMMLRDMRRYLVDDILHKVDRASMAVSLEARSPILDHRLIEYAWSLPITQKCDGSKGKLPLRAILKKYIPEDLYERPKQGFGVPISAWLRSDLKNWAEALLFSESSNEFFYATAIKSLWDEHITGKFDRGAYLWNILLFLQWYEFNKRFF
jgi:asparagine synthase (glutamine-hydrolysing)